MSTATEIDMHRALAQEILDITNKLKSHVSHMCDYHDRIEIKIDKGVVVKDFYVSVLERFKLTAHGLISNKGKKLIGFQELIQMVMLDLVMILRALVELKNKCMNTFKHAV